MKRLSQAHKEEIQQINLQTSITTCSVSKHLQPFDAVDLVQQTMWHLIPLMGKYRVIYKRIVINVDLLILGADKQNGHGQFLQAELDGVAIANITLSLHSIRNKENLIAVLLHQLAMMMTVTSIEDYLDRDFDGTSGHTNKFYAANAALICLCKGDPQLQDMVDYDSDAFIVNRHLDITYESECSVFNSTSRFFTDEAAQAYFIEFKKKHKLNPPLQLILFTP
jgi:hypothetical protein